MSKKKEVETKELGKYEIKMPHPLVLDDFVAAKAYAANNPSDPFAYARALSRLQYYLCLPSDLADTKGEI